MSEYPPVLFLKRELNSDILKSKLYSDTLRSQLYSGILKSPATRLATILKSRIGKQSVCKVCERSGREPSRESSRETFESRKTFENADF